VQTCKSYIFPKIHSPDLTGRRVGLLRLVICLVISITPVFSLAQNPNTHPILLDDELYLMDIRTADRMLADSVLTYKSDEDYLVNFRLFLDAVEFPIEQQGRAWSGWFRNKESAFYWSLGSGELLLAGDAAREATAAEWSESNGETYVSLRLLETWFDLTLIPKLRQQRIVLFSDDPLPFQVREKRLASKNRFAATQASRVDVHVPDQYQWVTLPLFDLSAYSLIQGRTGSLTSAQTGSMTVGMDLLKHSVVYAGAVAYSTDLGSDTSQRLTIERGAPTREASLFLGVTRYAFGDILSTNSDLVSSNGTGLGFRIERSKPAGSGTRDTATISGNALPGWETELYRNGVLITFGSVDTDGRYIFPDQEVVYGENLFVVKLYGPQGRIEEHQHTYWGGGIELDQGDYDFSASYTEFGERFIDGRGDDPLTLTADRSVEFRYGYGLTRNLQLGAGFSNARIRSRNDAMPFVDQQYGSLYGRMNLGAGLLLAEAVQQKDRGSAWSLRYLTNRKGHHLSITHKSIGDFESPYTLNAVQFDSLNQVTLAGPVDWAGMNSYVLRVTRQDRADGLRDMRVFSRLGMRLGQTNFSNDLEYYRDSEGATSYLGLLRVSGRLSRFGVRGQLSYDPGNSKPFNQVAGNIRWNMNRRWHNSLTISRDLKNDRTFNVDNILSANINDTTVSLTFNVASNKFWAVGLGVNVHFSFDQQSGQLITNNRNLANSGRATMNLFIDDNNNGVRDPGELPVEWAAYKNEETAEDAPGKVSLVSVPSRNAYQIETRFLKFDDPFLVPRHSVYELYTHAGSDINVDIAVVVTGVVEGYVYTGAGKDAKGARGVEVSLYKTNGERVATTLTEFDGYYSFDNIAVGQYEISIDGLPGEPAIHVQRFSLNSEEGYKLLDNAYVAP